MKKSTITINGRTYDAITGMPVVTHGLAQKPAATPVFSDVATKPAHHKHAPAQAVHHTPERSRTLNRGALRKPEPITRHNLIRKFQPAGTANQAQLPAPAQAPIQAAGIHAPVHPLAAKAAAAQAPQPQQTPLNGSALKEQLIKERLAEVQNVPAKKQARSSWLGRQPRLATILSSTLALLILGGYLTYITLPSISLKVAASRAGVNASMPEYQPDGYSLDGPITYSPGEVIISYKSNTNETGYKLTQKATSWDSQGVLDNYVTKMTDNYLTFQERGITVYTFGSKAIWVNGGLLYTVDGDAALSADQILRLATSI